jgi:hypothetical protein
MHIAQLVTHRSLDDLESEIINLAARINSAEYDFLVLVREFDLRQEHEMRHRARHRPGEDSRGQRPV